MAPIPSPLMSLDFVHTLAFGGLVLWVGHGICRALPLLGRANIPAPVVGGLVVASLVWVMRAMEVELVSFDTRLQAPLMIAFFTTVGFGASLSRLRVGGPQVLAFTALCTVLVVLQNALGAGAAVLLGQHPLFGVLNGSVTLAGGPATALAFAPLFERAGVSGASTVAVAAAMAGIVAGGLLGGPVGTALVHRLRRSHGVGSDAGPHGASAVETATLTVPPTATPRGEAQDSHALLKALVLILGAMWAGAWLSGRLEAVGLTLPAYIGAMLVAAALRAIDDATGWLRLSHQTIDSVGNVALSLFLVLALMTLRLWELSGLVAPMIVILIVQMVMVAAVGFWLVFPAMGRDYDAAVMSSGLCGFMLGTTANAMANMGALADRYGPAPRAFLVVPMVGAFFIDFINALIITVCLNLWG